MPFSHLFRSISLGFASLSSFHLSAAIELADLLPLQDGYTAVTCSAGVDVFTGEYNLDAPVVGIFNTSESELAATPTGDDSVDYLWKAFHNEELFQDVPDPAEIWNGHNLGEVFGLTLDDQDPPNIFVSATSAYVNGVLGDPVWPAGEGPGSVYRLDGNTGEITTCVQLPSISNAALGNLCFHRDGFGAGWLYITNIEDGLIYRVSHATCTVEDTFAHPAAPADDGLPGPSQFGRRMWGLAIHEGRLFYHLWNDYATTPQQIWSVALNPDGSFDLSDVLLEFDVPPYLDDVSSPPVSDIDFDDEGTMYLSERSFGEKYVPHSARILKFIGSSGSYTACPLDTYIVGNLWPGTNSAGGVTTDCNGRIWASSNTINDVPYRTYGMTSFEEGGNTTDDPPWANSYIVDYDGMDGQEQKNQLGEVDIYRIDCQCLEVEVGEIECPEQPNAGYDVELIFTNFSEETAVDWVLTPCPQGELPPGSVSILDPVFGSFSPFLDPGESQSIFPNLPSIFGGQTVCFNVTINGIGHEEICTVKICVDIPNCDCFTIIKKDLECVYQQGEFKWNMTILFENESDFTATNVLITPLPGSLFDPISMAPDGGPVAPGEEGSITFCVTSSGDPALVPGDTICFDMTLEIPGTPFTCTEDCCVKLPPCPVTEVPDKCILARRTPCCPSNNKANVSFTLCNNSDEERIYTWGVQPTFGCDFVLPPGSYTPPGESVIVPANTCITRTIMIDCSSLAPGACAAFKVCFERVNPTPGPEICCVGTVYAPLPGQLVAKLANPDKPVLLPWGKIDKLAFTLSNPSSQPIATELFVESDLGMLDFGQGFTSSGLFFPVQLQPNEERLIELPLQLNPRASFYKPTCLTFSLGAQGSLLASGFVTLKPNTLEIEDITLNNAQTEVSLLVRTERGKTYQLQRSSLATPLKWDSIGNPVEGADLPFEMTAPIAQGSQRDFFRLIESE